MGATLEAPEVRMSWSDERIDDLANRVDNGFEQVDRRFEQVDQRFEQVDRRFEQVDQRFEQVDQRFEQVDKRFEQVHADHRELRVATERGFSEVRQDMAQVRSELKQDIERSRAENTALSEGLNARFDSMHRIMIGGLVAIVAATLGANVF